jgi:hypothetical protein
VAFPIPRLGIELDAAAPRLAARDGNGGLREIRTRFMVPDAELHDSHRLTCRAYELAPEIARKPVCLQLEFGVAPGGAGRSEASPSRVPASRQQA